MRIGSLCTGYDGLALGIQQVIGGRVVWTSDIDKGACKVIAHRYPDAPNLGDLTVIDWAALNRTDPIDVLCAGYPCQPFSGNGRRKGEDDPRHLWPHIIRAIRCLRPGLVVLENVEDHLTLGFGVVLSDLAAAGLDAEWCVLRASDVGAPHGRPRVFVVATDPSRFVYAPTEPGGMAGALCAQSSPPGAECVHRPGPRDHEDEGAADDGGAREAWGPYAEAIERWERLSGRRSPVPLVDRVGIPDISPRFVEWAMGLPDGWVTDVPGLTVDQQFRALGNGVVPQQAAAALRLMLAHLEGEVAA